MPLLLQPQAEPLPGYRLLEPLGKGGFGEVWKCEAPGGLFKAVKIVRNKADDLDAEGADAELEFQALEYVRSVRHPFLLSMDRIEIVDGVLVVVMELADESLHDQLRHYQSVGQAGVPRGSLLARLWEAAEVLDVMNLRHRLLHLDVKPHNLLLLGGHVKVADFGLVSRLPRSPAQAPTCRPGVVSPVYASPEAFQGDPSPSSDQYSLAVSYHELLTGELPFEAKNVRQMAMQHAHAEPDLSRLPEADRAVVARALSKDPAKRFLSCTQFIAALLAASRPARWRAGSPAAHAAGSPAARPRPGRTRPWTPPRPAPDRGTAAPAALLARCQFEECVARGETTGGLDGPRPPKASSATSSSSTAWPRSTPTPAATACTCWNRSAIRGWCPTIWSATTAAGSSSSCRARGRPCASAGRPAAPRAGAACRGRNCSPPSRTSPARWTPSTAATASPTSRLNPDAVQLVNGQALTRRLRPGRLVLAAVRPAAGRDQSPLRRPGTRRQRRQPLLRSV